MQAYNTKQTHKFVKVAESTYRECWLRFSDDEEEDDEDEEDEEDEEEEY